ncbi:MAG: helicase [Candidatus Delongbacteria bacterium]|nr:helicase [Candidatus Delongbacteria bacterium]
MNSDLTFITNEQGKYLKERFDILIKDSRYFDCLVGYFYISGFFAICDSLEQSERIRILVGIGTDRQTIDYVFENYPDVQKTIDFSHAETKIGFEGMIIDEMEKSQDNRHVEFGVKKFVEWIRNKKLEIRAYPSRHIHAKLYIVSFKENDRDSGRVITGSSNLTQAGLIDNLEFNVELKNSADYRFALCKFEELWRDSVDINQNYIETIEHKTWLNQNISPYQLYLKFLYEYFKDELNQSGEVFSKYYPPNFMRLEYQEQAVLNAKKIVEEYGGVFISDVVGLGKTYIATMLAGQLDGRTLVMAPPALLDRDNPGSWPNAFSDFHTPADFESLGKLDDILRQNVDKYKNIIIDESHRFRTETTISYEKMAEICRGKRIILVTATPYNNSPKDILAQIKLFQNVRKSTIPNLSDLELFFSDLERRLKKSDRQRDYENYIRIVKQNAREIREKVLKYLMVRRTRTEIINYFDNDLKIQNLRFPDIDNPEPLYYELDDREDEVFMMTIRLISQKFTYARYTPMLYLNKEINHLEKQAQRNMGAFMKLLLVKRLESSFFAFRNSIDRFIHSYEMFIHEFGKGNVYISKKYSNKILEFLESDDDAAIEKLIMEGKAEHYSSHDFKSGFIRDLRNDLDVLMSIKKQWCDIVRDPKLVAFLSQLKNNSILADHKMIVFTESKETAEYLTDQINHLVAGTALCFTGRSGDSVRDQVIRNFDAKSRHPANDYRILVSTDVLSEGVNLHRSNVVVNYDIPWNPTRMMQRVGRINRVDTSFDTIHTFNFFPTQQSNSQIKLKEAAEAKINAFLTLLGGDAALLLEGEPVASHELFSRLVSKKTLTGEDEDQNSELKFLQVIKGIRDTQPELFDQVKRLPKKARSVRYDPSYRNSLITYFRRDKLQKFYMSAQNGPVQEMDFISAAGVLECKNHEKRSELSSYFYSLLDKNKAAFIDSTVQSDVIPESRRGKDNAIQLLRLLRVVFKNTRQLTDDQEIYLRNVFLRLEEGGLPKQTTKETLKVLNGLDSGILNPIQVLGVLQTTIPPRLLEGHYSERRIRVSAQSEVILSLYLSGD